MEELPYDLIGYLTRFISVGDIINITRVCKTLHDCIIDTDELIYLIAKHNNDNSKFKIKFDNTVQFLFSKYYRGKCYGSDEKDIPFELRSGEHLLCCIDILMSDNDVNGVCIITINHNYNFYFFIPVVSPTFEFTPDYYGWEMKDLDIKELYKKEELRNLYELQSHLEDLYNNGSHINDKRLYISDYVDVCLLASDILKRIRMLGT